MLAVDGRGGEKGSVLAESKVTGTCGFAELLDVVFVDAEVVCSLQIELIIEDLGRCVALNLCGVSLLAVLDAQVLDGNAILGSVVMAVHDETGMGEAEIERVANRGEAVLVAASVDALWLFLLLSSVGTRLRSPCLFIGM